MSPVCCLEGLSRYRGLTHGDHKSKIEKNEDILCFQHLAIVVLGIYFVILGKRAV